MNAIRCRSKFEKETQLYLSSKDMNKERNSVLDLFFIEVKPTNHHGMSASN